MQSVSFPQDNPKFCWNIEVVRESEMVVKWV